MSARQPEPGALATRYGRRRPRRRLRARIAIGVVAVIGVAWVVWAAWGQSRPSVSGFVDTFQVQSPHAIRVTVTITPVGDASAHCALEALASDHSTVGRIEVRLPAHTPGARTVTRVVKTERLATSARLNRCGSGG